MTAQPKVLLASSNATDLLAQSRALRLRGWELSTAGDAAHALANARRLQPDAVVLDARLPAGGSLLTARRLSASPHTAGVPILVAGQCSAEEQAALREAGALAFVPDGGSGEAVLSALDALLRAPAPVPVVAPGPDLNAPVRQAALKASGLLEHCPKSDFDRLIRLVSGLLSTPAALLSLVDKNRQVFLSQQGIPEPWAARGETPLTHSFCQWVVSGREPVVVDDARQHRLLRGNHAIQDLGVVAYAGVPVTTVEGEALGALCAIDSRPRAWSANDVATLEDLARMADCWVAREALSRQPPRSAQEFDRYVDAAGAALAGAVDILRRHGGALTQADREFLLDRVAEYGQHLLQLNRLILVNQSL